MNRIFSRKPLVSATYTMSSNIRSNHCSASRENLKGKVAIVTASTDGIGFAIAKRLAHDGASVVICSRKAQNVSKAVADLKAGGLTNVLGIKCHVASKEDRHTLFAETIKQFGGLDILISNAAVNPEVGGVLDASEDAWDKIFDINVKAAFMLAKEARPLISKRGGGSIVFISSIAGYNPFQLLGAYSISKTTLFGLTKAAAQNVATENIRVNCVAPGVIQTKFSKPLYESETALETALQSIPLKKLGQPDEIAGVVSFLVSEDASYITGETITAAGGMLSRL